MGRFVRMPFFPNLCVTTKNSLTRPRTTENYPLQQWVQQQRLFRARLSAQEERRLEALGFEWDPLDEEWEPMFKNLERYKSTNGNVLVPHGDILGLWLTDQVRIIPVF